MACSALGLHLGPCAFSVCCVSAPQTHAASVRDAIWTLGQLISPVPQTVQSWLVRLSAKKWCSGSVAFFSATGACIRTPAFALVAAHSLKCTLLAWGRRLGSDSELRRIQGHHRASGSSVGLYSRDDVVPMLRLQRQIVTSVRSGFRPLQPVARGLDDPLPDFPVSLPSPSSVPDHFLLSPDCLPEASPLPAQALPPPARLRW